MLPAGHANPAAAYAAVPAAGSVSGLDGYQRLHAASISAQPPVVVAASAPADVQQSVTQCKDLVLSSNSSAVNDTLLSVRLFVCPVVCSAR